VFILYKILKCRHCGKIQVTCAVKVFKCKKCDKSNPVKKCILYYVYDNPLIARDICDKIEYEVGIKNEERTIL